MTTTIVVVNPYSRKLERYDIGGLTPEELQALPLDERICEDFYAGGGVDVGDAGAEGTRQWIVCGNCVFLPEISNYGYSGK